MGVIKNTELTEIECYKSALNHIVNWNKDLEYDFQTKENIARYALDWNFRQWQIKLKEIAISKFQFDPNIDFDYEAFRHYFDGNLSPEDALIEDFNN